jgi:hypothetical protein
MRIAKILCLGTMLLLVINACSNTIVTPQAPTVSEPVPATLPPTVNVTHTPSPAPTLFINAATALAGTRPPRTPVTPTRTRTATATRAPGAAPVVSQSGKPEPTVLRDAKQIPETHQGRTQCLTCHEFGNVGPPMPQFHKDDKYTDNSFCTRCHIRP